MGDIEMPVEKRGLLRRAVAFVIDWIIVSLGVLVVAIILQQVTGISFKTPEIVSITSCRNADLVPPDTFQAFGEDFARGEHTQEICEISNMGLAPYYITIIGTVSKTDGSSQTRSVRYTSDADGNPARSISLEWIVPLLAPLFFAFQLSRKRATFGKRILAINVVTLENSTPTLRAALRREILKFSPILLSILFDMIIIMSWFGEFNSGLGTPEQIVNELAPLVPDPFSLTAWIVPSALLSLIVVIFYLGSFVRWRGQTFWDRFAGLKVTNI